MAPELLSKQNANECREIMCIYIYIIYTQYIYTLICKLQGNGVCKYLCKLAQNGHFFCHYYYSAKEQKTWPELGQPTLRRSSFPKLVLSTWGLGAVHGRPVFLRA
jgi:hypothetical protein